MNEILDIIHKTIYQFFDVCGDDEEVPISNKDKLLLEVNKAICNNLKALQQQPCEDAISREETLKAFAEKCGGECGCCEYNGSGYDTAENCKLIKSIPSVTPTRPKGKWIDKGIGRDEMYAEIFVCSECGSYGFYDNFCPNCGADMRGDKNE